MAKSTPAKRRVGRQPTKKMTRKSSSKKAARKQSGGKSPAVDGPRPTKGAAKRDSLVEVAGATGSAVAASAVSPTADMKQLTFDISMLSGVVSVTGRDTNNRFYTSNFGADEAKRFLARVFQKTNTAFYGQTVELRVNGAMILADQ